MKKTEILKKAKGLFLDGQCLYVCHAINVAVNHILFSYASPLCKLKSDGREWNLVDELKFDVLNRIAGYGTVEYYLAKTTDLSPLSNALRDESLKFRISMFDEMIKYYEERGE